MKKLLTGIVSLLLLFSASAQNRKLDSLRRLIATHPEEDTLRVQFLYQACYYEYTSDNEQNKVHATEALAIAQNIHYQKGIGYAQKYLALYYWMVGNYEEASRHGYEMLRVFEKTNNKKAFGQAYAVLAIINQDGREFEKAKANYEKALSIHQQAKLLFDVAYDYNGLATLYEVWKKPTEALASHEKALEIRRSIHDENGLSQTYSNMALIYKSRGDYAKAIEYCEMAQPILQKMNNQFRLCGNYGNLGAVYILTGDYTKAELYLLKSLAMAKTLKHKLILTELYNSLYDLEEKRGNFKKANAYIALKYSYKDSMFNEDKSRRIAEIEALYQTEKKDHIIETLEKEKDIHQLKQIYTIIGIAFLVLTFAAVYFLQRIYTGKIKRLLSSEKNLNGKLVEADQLKSVFFANISHEFRTPLSLIIAPIEEKLRAVSLSTNEKESFLLVKRNADRLLGLVNQLLDLSKLEAKKMELYIRKGDLKKWIEVISASFDSLAESRQIQFTKKFTFLFTETWYDAGKIETILNNLLFNAFKFTPAGGSVDLSINCGDHGLRIMVSDTGKGIPEHERDHIFSPFYQSRYLADDGQPGTGLGLAMVRELVNLYGGAITLKSIRDEGSVFIVALPVDKLKFPAKAIVESVEINDVSDIPAKEDLQQAKEDLRSEDREDSTEELSPETILVVEDNADLRDFIADSLRTRYSVVTARDGKEGIERAIDFIPDLVLSDVMMPNADGFALTERLKNDERTSHIPIVLLTAKADAESKIEGLTTGADDYLSKPFSTEELHVRIGNLILQRKKLAEKYKAGIHEAKTIAPVIPSIDDKFLTRATEIVNEYMTDTDFGVEEMADKIHLSRTQLFRKLKAISGLSPNEFINEIRMNRAAELIHSRADTLAQICYAVGFSEQSYFAKRFRRKFGMSPTEYQNKANKPQDA